MELDRRASLKEGDAGMPEGWRTAELASLVEFSRKPRDLNLAAVEQVPFVPMALIPDSGLYLGDWELRSPKEIRSGTFFREGDVLLAKITPCLENGKQGIA
jgi:type I restriction enzyme S subunit